MIDLKAVSTS